MTLNDPLLTQERTDQFLVNDALVRLAGATAETVSLTERFYQAEHGRHSASVTTRTRNLLLFVDGVDLKYEILAAWYARADVTALDFALKAGGGLRGRRSRRHAPLPPRR